MELDSLKIQQWWHGAEHSQQQAVVAAGSPVSVVPDVVSGGISYILHHLPVIVCVLVGLWLGGLLPRACSLLHRRLLSLAGLDTLCLCRQQSSCI